MRVIGGIGADNNTFTNAAGYAMVGVKLSGNIAFFAWHNGRFCVISDRAAAGWAHFSDKQGFITCIFKAVCYFYFIPHFGRSKIL